MAELKLVTVEEAANQLGLAVITVRTWISMRRLGHVRLGRAIRITQAEIDRLIERGTIPAKVS